MKTEAELLLTPRNLPIGLNKDELLRMYEQMVLLRRFELKVEELLKKAEMPGFAHIYVGEEAVAVGVCAHLSQADLITSTHRGHGHALAKGMSPNILMAELMGRATGCCGGRGGTMHLYDSSIGLFGGNGIVGAGMPLAVGAAFSAKTRGTDEIAVAFFGDGATNHGVFHESVNFAAIQNVPVIFVCENNLYATTTHISKATKNTDIAGKAAAYGIPSIQVDGNDIVAVWNAMDEAVKRARSGNGPTFIETKTYRWNGHYVGEPLYGTYRTKEEVEQWKSKCPIKRMRELLEHKLKVASNSELQAIEEKVEDRIAEAVQFAKRSPLPSPAAAYEHIWAEPINPPESLAKPAINLENVEKRFLEAVVDAIAEEMRRDSNILYFGEGTAKRGGNYAQSKGLWNEFGDRQNIDTPICELGFTGVAIGASATGCRSIADLMFADLMFEAASQIVNQAAKLSYMSNGQYNTPVIIRAPIGNCNQGGSHHSGSYYPMWAHCPGLIIAIPSNPADAQGLMKTALRSSNPVVFLEHKGLFKLKGPVPTGEYFVPFGQAKVIEKGNDVTMVSCGLLVHHCLEAASRLKKEGISCEVIDIRTIVPLDVNTIAESVKKTGRLLVADEAYSMCGIGGEIAAAMMETTFKDLRCPVVRIHTDPVAHPFSAVFDKKILVTAEKLVAAVKNIMEGKMPLQPRFGILTE